VGITAWKMTRGFLGARPAPIFHGEVHLPARSHAPESASVVRWPDARAIGLRLRIPHLMPIL